MENTTTECRKDWSWLEGTYWFCPEICMPAIQTQPDNTFKWVIDQTVWQISGCQDGYFWGAGAVLLTDFSKEPNAAEKTAMTFFGSITSDGRVHITFISSKVTTTVATGRMTEFQGKPSFEMQMSSGPNMELAVHWAYMLQIGPGDPQWDNLPGAGVSVDELLSGTEPPKPKHTER